MGSFQERACGSAILFGLIVGSILLALSFYIVEPNYVGVDYNHVTESIDEVKLYTSGRHFLGIGHEMVLFSTTQQTRDLGVLTGRSKDGLSVQFEVSYQFMYDQDIQTLVRLYKDYEKEHLPWFDFFAASSLRNTLAEFTAFEVIQKRDELQVIMTSDLSTLMENEGIQITALQLLNTELPLRFMDAIEQTILAEQNVEKAEFEREKARITGDTLRLQSTISASNLVVTATAQATSTIVEAEASAAAIMVQLTAEKSAYKALYDSAQEKFKEVQRIQAVAADSGFKLTWGGTTIGGTIPCGDDGQAVTAVNTIASELESLAGITDVTVTANSATSPYQWDVTFNDAGVGNADMMTSDTGDVAISEIAQGFSSAHLLAYIWTESLAETDAGGVQVNFKKQVEVA